MQNGARHVRSMRILVVSIAYVVGAYQAKLAALGRRASVALLSPSRWKFPGRSAVMELERPDSRIAVYPAEIAAFNGRQGAFIFPWGDVRRALEDFRPDVIYLEQEVYALSAFEIAVAARIYGVPLVVFCWENVPRQLSPPRWLTTRFVLNTARLVTPGNRAAAALLGRWGYKGAIEVLPQVGVDLDAQAGTTRSASPVFTIAYAGRLVWEKGVDLILKAAQILKDDAKDVRIVICGAGPEEQPLRTLAEKLGLSGVVDWRGELDHRQVAGALADADVLVLPSRTLPGKWQEQFGHVLIEAMALAIPVVGSKSGAIPEVLGRNDLLFEENNAAGLAALLAGLIADGQLRKQLSIYGLERVRRLYSNDAIADRLIGCLGSVVDTPFPGETELEEDARR